MCKTHFRTNNLHSILFIINIYADGVKVSSVIFINNLVRSQSKLYLCEKHYKDMEKQYIKKIEIKGFWGKKDVCWNNIHQDVNIVVGINGSGKTRHLKGVFILRLVAVSSTIGLHNITHVFGDGLELHTF